LLVASLVYLQDSLLLARLFPYTGVIVVGNTTLPLIALLAGTLIGRHPGAKSSALQRFLLPAFLVGLGVAHASFPFWGSEPTIHPVRMLNGVFMQTSESSCSAASAATLLTHLGIPATEAEMAHMGFTRSVGTSLLGVYRGFRLKTRGKPFRVETLVNASVDDLRRITQENPVLLSVGLDRFSNKRIDPRYTEAWGWTPGKRHAVVLFGFLPGDYLDIGDPSVGREKWRLDSLEVLWHGDGIYLRPTDTPAPSGP
jgi:hypothetical protein